MGEASVGTLGDDPATLALRYARHGVRDYWVIDPAASVVHVSREPRIDATDFAHFMPTAGTMPDETT